MSEEVTSIRSVYTRGPNILRLLSRHLRIAQDSEYLNDLFKDQCEPSDLFRIASQIPTVGVDRPPGKDR